MLERGDQKRKTYFWPFGGRKDSIDSHTLFILYPIYRYQFSLYRTRESKRRYILPFYWSWSESDTKAMTSRKRMKGWPLLDYYEESSLSRPEDTRSRLRLLSPLWFRDPKGFERNYGVFWIWYTYEKRAEGKTRQRILWYLLGD